MRRVSISDKTTNRLGIIFVISFLVLEGFIFSATSITGYPETITLYNAKEQIPASNLLISVGLDTPRPADCMYDHTYYLAKIPEYMYDDVVKISLTYTNVLVAFGVLGWDIPWNGGPEIITKESFFTHIDGRTNINDTIFEIPDEVCYFCIVLDKPHYVEKGINIVVDLV